MAKKNKTPDLFDDEIIETPTDFARLLNQSSAIKKLSVGDLIRGEILSMGKEAAFISTQTPVDGILPIADLIDSKKQNQFKVGDIIEARVIRIREGEIFLKKLGSTQGSEDVESLEDAFDMELAVEGKVTEANKGGFKVLLFGKSAFCPMSQMDSKRIDDVDQYVGKKFSFQITKFEANGRNIVVSRRKLLDQERQVHEQEFIETKMPGDILRGKISRLERFGAFVEFEHGVEALIPISELSYSRVNHPQDVVQVGQEVDVALLKISEDEKGLRIAVSLKGAGGESDPWSRITTDYPVGKVVTGEVERKEAYGLFVRISPYFTGLLPRSKWRDHLEGAKYESRKKGDLIQVQIAEILLEQHKISLSVPDDQADENWVQHQKTNTVAQGFGQLSDLLKKSKL